MRNDVEIVTQIYAENIEVKHTDIRGYLHADKRGINNFSVNSPDNKPRQ
jgi:hypothetical protein